jgi:hypothetical protein
MITLFNAPEPARKAVSADGASVPIEQLVEEVYAWANPQAQDHMLAKLVGKVYETAPPPIKIRMLEQLLRPAGLLSLIAVANGVFARIRFRGGWPEARLQLDDLQTIQASDIVALVEHVVQMGGAALDGLGDVLLCAPDLAGSGAAAVLVRILQQRAGEHRSQDRLTEQPISLYAAL